MTTIREHIAGTLWVMLGPTFASNSWYTRKRRDNCGKGYFSANMSAYARIWKVEANFLLLACNDVLNPEFKSVAHYSDIGSRNLQQTQSECMITLRTHGTFLSRIYWPYHSQKMIYIYFSDRTYLWYANIHSPRSDICLLKILLHLKKISQFTGSAARRSSLCARARSYLWRGCEFNSSHLIEWVRDKWDA